MSEVLSTTEPYFSEVTITIKSQSSGAGVPPIKIAHTKAKSKNQNSLIGPHASESDLWSDLATFITHHGAVCTSQSESAEARLILDMPNRPISLYVTFFGSKKGSNQRSFESPTLFLSTSHRLPSKKLKAVDEDTTSPMTSHHFITPSPSSYAHSLVCSPQASSTISSAGNLCNSFPSNLRLTPASATRDISHDFDMELPPFSLPSSIYDSDSKVPTSLSSTLSSEGTCILPESQKPIQKNRILHHLLNQFATPSMLARMDWSAVFAFVVGETAEECEQKKKDLKCASVPTVPQARKRCTEDSCVGDCEHACPYSNVHKSWRVCRRGEFNPSLLSSEDFFTIPSEFEHIRAQVQRNEAPVFGYAINPVPFGDLRSAIGSSGESLFPPYGAPPVLDIERLGHSPSELCYQYYC